MSSAFPVLRPLGATPADPGHVTFRVWAHEAERVAVELRGERRALEPEGFGVWSATLEAAHGDRYRYLLGDAGGLPDPASRWQPEGLRGPSAVVDPGTFAWTDGAWAGVAVEELVIYELHVGTFTPEGTFDAAAAHLPELAELGVTAIEVMPVAEFPGRYGWGYDGVYLSARTPPSASGGPPRPLALRAHRRRAGARRDGRGGRADRGPVWRGAARACMRATGPAVRLRWRWN